MEESASVKTIAGSPSMDEEIKIVKEIAGGIQDLKKEVRTVSESVNKTQKPVRKISGKTCDECEREVLENIEKLLDKNKIEEALELIKWRQEEIKQCEIDFCIEGTDDYVLAYAKVVI
eukprot:TRINITY_DN17978_c0_g1_i1.p2 TRINITY_DN17978_c0_g1~~TRINITY_DN17978_c0_g1_i1.p2  ORF type:complete len:118 (-),score=33.48 TRINITY_DN17978_c0_g1_i1:280-633(-)